MPNTQTIDEVERVDLCDPETFVAEPRYNFADFGIGTEFIIRHASYSKRHMRVYKVVDNHIMCTDMKDPFPQFCLTRTNLAFYAKRDLITITREAF